MLILGNAKIPAAATEKLSQLGVFVLFQTHNIVYDAVSGHPDVFFCQVDGEWVVAPNVPGKYKKRFIQKEISFCEGENSVGKIYPQTAFYNAVVTEKYLIHNLKVTDSVIKQQATGKIAIHVNQAYTRCSLLPLSRDRFITSDKGIYKTLIREQIETFYFSPDNILLPGFNHGFFGGCCGIYKNRIFIIGQLKYHADGEKLRDYLEKLNYEIIELYDGPLFDGGSLLFLP